MWQQILIALAVLIATVYVAWTLTGPRLRQRLLEGMIQRGIAVAWATRYRARLSASGCGSCPVSKQKARNG